MRSAMPALLMTVLIIAPHPDDEAIGCGGAICKHVDVGDQVVVVFLTSGELGLKNLERESVWKTREAEAQACARLLGIRECHFLRQPDSSLSTVVEPAASALASHLQRIQPQLIYATHPLEWHSDHKAAVAILFAAMRQAGVSPAEIRGYEIWTPLAEFQVVIDIEPVMPRKLEAIRCHHSQFAEIDYAQAAQGLNAYRGAIATRTRFAEVFQTLHPPP